ncbi:MAG: hypothetical protein F4Y34_04935 [Gammaproteobacteria bacterium]|nr:hypothetical protein [Gammaproteobacteria bacterium]
MASGHFMADVTLGVEFGASPAISGVIDSFGGHAASPDWIVPIPETGLADGTVEMSERHALGHVSLRLKPDEGSRERPRGVYGGFPDRLRRWRCGRGLDDVQDAGPGMTAPVASAAALRMRFSRAGVPRRTHGAATLGRLHSRLKP